MSNQLTNDNILAALGGVKDPEIGRDLVSLGMVKNVTIDGSVVDLTVEELMEQAKASDIEGRSSMDKAELELALGHR